jgi:hypothetical protein
MTFGSVVFYAALFGLGYVLAPTMLVWGWLRWITHRPRLWTIPSTLSFVGLLLVTASALYGLWIICYGANGGFQNSYSNASINLHLFYRFIGRGMVLTLMALLFGIGGMWRRGPLRWQSPASAVGMLAFWLIATTWP